MFAFLKSRKTWSRWRSSKTSCLATGPDSYCLEPRFFKRMRSASMRRRYPRSSWTASTRWDEYLVVSFLWVLRARFIIRLLVYLWRFLRRRSYGHSEPLGLIKQSLVLWCCQREFSVECEHTVTVRNQLRTLLPMRILVTNANSFNRGGLSDVTTTRRPLCDITTTREFLSSLCRIPNNN